MEGALGHYIMELRSLNSCFVFFPTSSMALCACERPTSKERRFFVDYRARRVLESSDIVFAAAAAKAYAKPR